MILSPLADKGSACDKRHPNCLCHLAPREGEDNVEKSTSDKQGWNIKKNCVQAHTHNKHKHARITGTNTLTPKTYTHTQDRN